MHSAVLGTQWGDEGKGKIIDLVAKEHDIIVRAQGGNNAGHTVVINNVKYPFHLLPSAILHPDKICILGNGMVIDPDVLLSEIKNIKAKIGEEHAKLMISDRAHIIEKKHISSDKKKGKKVGTTGRGIGPTYADKINRSGKRYENHNGKLAKYVQDTSLFLFNEIKKGKTVLFEGAQATMLDIDHGTYPFVTSSNCTVGGFFTGTGIFVRDLNVIGVAKAYTTRVGEGPFVTELGDYEITKKEKRDNSEKLLVKINNKNASAQEIGRCVRLLGKEYGTTTGRPRRCGWLDTVILRYAARVNNLSNFALTKLDVLSGLKELKICDCYRIGKDFIREIPSDITKLQNAVPAYISMPGWDEDITKCRKFEKLPLNAQNYVKMIEELTGVPVKYIGIGPNRDEIIIR